MSDTAVSVENLTVQFDDFVAVDNITFSVNKGEIFGFLGANGAGKTTTIRVLTGLLIPTKGQVKVAGVQLGLANLVEVKKRVGYMSQKFTLYNELSVIENLRFTSDLRSLAPEVAAQRQKELIDLIEFSPPLTTMVKDLPGGMKQQVALANSIIHDPEIIFLDEPTAGVSPAARSLFWNLIRKLSDSGKTIFVTSHYMDEVEQCHRIALMRAGQVIALDSPEGLKRSAFPEKMYEIEPLEEISAEVISEWKKSNVFALLDPYGHQFHATIQNEDAWREFQNRNRSLIEVREIKPSLEDVFIRMVEGAQR